MISCHDDGAQIKIHSASWGRDENSSECETYFDSGHCAMTDYTPEIGQMCDGKSSCVVRASGRHFSRWRCFWDSPYAQVAYSCIQRSKQFRFQFLFL